MVKVKLLTYTPYPDAVVYYATKLTYTTDDPVLMWQEIMNNLDAPKYKRRMKKLIHTVLRRGHHSVLEHANFTFLIDGCSRVCTHQLVRHRVASYSHRSHRYTEVDSGAFQLPPTIEADEKLKAIYMEHVNNSIELYNALIENGIPKEDARFAILQAVSSPIMVTMNARELIHFFGLRLCTHAQWEIRHAATLMLKEAKRVAPIIFENVGPCCIMLGYCPEDDERCYLNIVKSWERGDSDAS